MTYTRWYCPTWQQTQPGLCSGVADLYWPWQWQWQWMLSLWASGFAIPHDTCVHQRPGSTLGQPRTCGIVLCHYSRSQLLQITHERQSIAHLQDMRIFFFSSKCDLCSAAVIAMLYTIYYTRLRYDAPDSIGQLTITWIKLNFPLTKTPPYWYRDSHCKPQMVVRLS